MNEALLLAAALHAEEEEIRHGRAGDAGKEDAACMTKLLECGTNKTTERFIIPVSAKDTSKIKSTLDALTTERGRR